MTVFDWKV